jgi:hypothetical protein
MNLDIGLLGTCLGSVYLIFSKDTSQEYSIIPIIEGPYFSCPAHKTNRKTIHACNLYLDLLIDLLLSINEM